MHAVAAALATIYAALVVIVLPLHGRVQYNRLLKLMESDPHEKLRFYRRNAARKVLLVAPIVAVGLFAGRSPQSIGLGLPTFRSPMSIVLPMGLLVGLIAGGFRLRTPSASVTVALAKQPRLLGLLPADHEERAAFAAVAISAGVCEELIYRGFGIAYVRWLWPAATTLDICLITAIAFGLVHLYQGWRGVTMTGVFGAVFAYVVILTGSLIPAVVLHSLLDLRLLMLPSAKLAEARGLAAQEASGQESVPATSVSTAPWPPSAGVPLLPPPGWYTDPWGQAGSSGWRWWDGGHWTQYSGNDH